MLKMRFLPQQCGLLAVTALFTFISENTERRNKMGLKKYLYNSSDE
jgi:hypothetical protein